AGGDVPGDALRSGGARSAAAAPAVLDGAAAPRHVEPERLDRCEPVLRVYSDAVVDVARVCLRAVVHQHPGDLPAVGSADRHAIALRQLQGLMLLAGPVEALARDARAGAVVAIAVPRAEILEQDV